MKLLLSAVLCFSITQLVKSDRERVEHGAAARFSRHDDSKNNHADLEALLGSKKDAEHFEELPPEEAKKRLKAIALVADTNKDGFIDQKELKDWVEHSIRSVDEEEVDDRMKELDADNDGYVTWSEYLEDAFAEQNITKLDADDRKALEEDQKYFNAADRDGDGRLDRQELSAFTAPENFQHMHPVLIEITMHEKDVNHDGAIDVNEYLGEIAENPKSEWHAVEKDRFLSEFDKDGDGLLKDSEITDWLIPDVGAIATQEANHLIEGADINRDGKLSIDEIVNAHKLFVGSEVTNYGESLHRVQHNEL